jgi:predicted O-methyltransferase YrrM
MSIVTPDVERYVAASRPDPDPVLAEMEAHGARERIPIVVPETGRLLHVLARAVGARRIVEIGTAIGVSTLHLARALPADGRLVSFEIDPARRDAARGYLERAGVLDRVDLRLEDALTGLRGLEGPFDLAFLDAAKGEYEAYLDAVLPLLRPGALVAVDNVLLSGAVATGRPVRHWTEEDIATARAVNRRLVDGPELEGAITPVGDGVGLAVVRAGS